MSRPVAMPNAPQRDGVPGRAPRQTVRNVTNSGSSLLARPGRGRPKQHAGPKLGLQNTLRAKFGELIAQRFLLAGANQKIEPDMLAGDMGNFGVERANAGNIGNYGRPMRWRVPEIDGHAAG